MSQPDRFERRMFMTPGPAGDLEAYFENAGPTFGRTAVLCAPNPRAGGTMAHKVVHAASRALRDAGWHTLRFNYRGVGKSAGGLGGHGEERADVDAMLGCARTYCGPGDALLVAGFSYGSWLGLPAGEDHPLVDRIIGIGLPLGVRDFPYPTGVGSKPLLIVQGRQDEFAGAEAVAAWAADRPGPTQVAWIDGGHFFHGRLQALQDAIRDFAG